MAYAATVTITPVSAIRGQNAWLIRVDETGGTTTGEWTTASGVSGVTVTGSKGWGRVITIVSRIVAKVSGTGVTYAPIWARITGAIASTSPDYLDGFSAAATINDGARLIRGLNESCDIYGRTNPDAGTNNVVTTELVIVEGAL